MIKQLHMVLAYWCPHCQTALPVVQEMAAELGVPLRIYDIDVPAEERAADDLVERYGDWAPDYLIPQVFVEYADGRVQHIFTGYSEGVRITQAKVQALRTSDWYRTLLQRHRSAAAIRA